MLKVFHKAIVVLCVAAIVGTFAGIAAAEHVYVYDFDANVGVTLNVDQNLVGQDNWGKLNARDNIYVKNTAATGWTGKYAYMAAGSANTLAQRPNDANWSFALQDGYDFDISVKWSATGGASFYQLAGLDTSVITDREAIFMGTFNGDLRWLIEEGVYPDTYKAWNYAMAIPTTGADQIYRVGFEVTAKGGKVYDFQPYYEDLTTPAGRVYVNGGNPLAVTFAKNLSEMCDSLYLYADSGSAGVVVMDEFRISQIPEPGTLALLATGLIGLLCYAWRKRR
ncbi:MAG: PEP-CTERM sorting domain-containing protein [Pirellulales bacterium]|nr:PEP-CTERM sorting domain-containing protein [Pirellulales bacterium]